MAATILERWENALGIGNRTSAIAVTTTLSFTVTGPIDNLIDGAYGDNYTDSVEINGGQSSKEIKFDFGVGVTKKITSFVWRKSSVVGHGDWKLAGSNDDITYYDITAAIATSGITFIKGESTGTNDGFYRYYKLIQTTGTTSSSPWNHEVEFRLSDSVGTDDRSVSAPSYANFFGTGMRSPYMNIGGTITWASNPNNIVDGTQADATYFDPGQTGRYIEFDFKEDILITELKWYQDNSASQGTWKWQGYDTATTSWVDLTSAFSLATAATTTVTAMSAVTDYYSKYRLQQVSGSTSSSPYIREIEFKVGQPAIVSGLTPTLISITPSTGGTSGGTPVTITGTNLTNTTDVKLGGTSATSIVVVDPATITCDTPAHAAGLVNLQTFDPGGNATLSNAFTYAGAALVSITPNVGGISGGTAVTIVGSLLTSATDVQFDGVSATSIVVVDDSHITCVTPAHAAGSVNVDVFTTDGNPSLVAGFTYSSDPIARVTQLPLLTLDLSAQKTRITQVPLLVLYQEEQPNRVTQLPELILYTPKAVPLPLPVIPEVPMSEVWAWLTTISVAHKGREQRSRLREVPRYRLQIGTLILDEADRRATYNMLMRYLKTVFLYPLFQYNARVTQPSIVSDTKIFTNTAFSDFRDGEDMVAYDPYMDKVHYLTISTVDGDGVNLDSPLTFNIPVYWQVCPAIKFRIVPAVGFTMNSIDGSMTLAMESVEPRVFQRPGAAPSLTTIDGILIVPERPLANDGVPEAFDFGVTWFDNDTSIPDNLNAWSNPLTSSKVSYNFDRRTKVDYWRAVVDTLKGRQNVALFPTFRDDLPLRDAAALNATTLTTANIDFYIWWLELTYKYIAISTANGMKYRKILDVIPHYDANGDPDYLTIYLNSSIGNTAGDNVIGHISYMNLFRLSDDNVKLTHYDLDTEIELSIQAVNR